MMPTCEHRWCRKTADKTIEVYASHMGKRTSAFANRRIFLCRKHYDKTMKNIRLLAEEGKISSYRIDSANESNIR